ncbi:MAG: ABC transporter substrate-binding protein [Clostridiales bacterium]|jgi:oligogalacturonide transport system substrate-binding protein|nr:ABC transporter substrate-binding protein [Clostridiales bacterium]
MKKIFFMKNGSKIIAAALAGIMLLSVAGCSSNNTNAPSPEAPPASEAAPAPEGAEASSGPEAGFEFPTEDITLTFSWWGSDSRHEAFQNVIDLYTAKHPNVTIEPDYGAFDSWTQKIQTQLGGQEEADVMQVNYNWVHSFGKGQNVFADLNQYGHIIDLSNWPQTDLDSMSTGGELGAVPHGTNARVFYYNKPLFEGAGIEYPKTYAELIEAGKVISANNTPTGADNKYVHINVGTPTQNVATDLFIAQMLYDKTGKVMQENGVVNYTIEEVAGVLNTYKSFEDAGAFPTYQQDDPIQNESNPLWTSGRVGSVFEWVGTMDKYLDSYKDGTAKDEIVVAPYITEVEGQEVKIYAKPSLGYAVSRNSEYPEVAADFINFMFTDEEAILALGTSLGVSSHKATREVQEREDFVKGAMKMGYDLLTNYELVIMDPYFEDENIRGQRYIAIEEFRSGKSDAQAAAKIYIENQQAELDKLLK